MLMTVLGITMLAMAVVIERGVLNGGHTRRDGYRRQIPAIRESIGTDGLNAIGNCGAFTT